jgi:hypothetical protein
MRTTGKNAQYGTRFLGGEFEEPRQENKSRAAQHYTGQRRANHCVRSLNGALYGQATYALETPGR